ncbi:MAG: glycosyltransferase family 39 protein [Bacteroidia bacterium]|nr:glycosyltransferase family 39 protein [Bacteroidia bacterium]
MAVILLILCGLLLRIFVATDLFLHPWDERYHALVAKNLMNHPFLPTLYENPVLPFDYKNWFSNHIWLHKQPFPLWSMALSMKAFGVNEIALRIPSILVSTLGILMTYRIGEYLFTKRTAFFAAFLFSIHGFIIELTGGRDATDHIDIFFLCLILFSVYFAIQFIRTQKQVFNLLTGVFIGLAVLSKWLPALIVFPVYFLLLLDSGKFRTGQMIRNLFLCIIYSAIVAVPWQVYIILNFPDEAKWEYAYNFLHITEPLNHLHLPFYYHVDHLQIKYGPVGLVAVIWYTYKTLKNPRHYKRDALVIWIIIPVLFFSFVKTKMQAYTLFIAPPIFLITALFFQYLWIYRRRFRYQAIPVILIFLLFFLPFWHTVERTKLFSTRNRSPEWVQEIKSLKIPTSQKPLVIFNAPHPIETMFYINCSAYPFMPDEGVVEKLNTQGYEVIVLDQPEVKD